MEVGGSFRYYLAELIDQSTLDTRARIVEAARTLFFAKGYNATGIAEILREAGANSGSLYYFFPTKEDLLRAVLEQYKQMLEPFVLSPAFERVADPIERIFAILDGYRRLMEATGFDLGCPIGNISLEVANVKPQLRGLLAENFSAWREAVESLIREAAGRLPAGTDPRSLAWQILATMEGAVLLARAYRSFEPFDAAVDALRSQFDQLLERGSTWGTPDI